MTKSARNLFIPTEERLYIVLENSGDNNTPVFDKDDIIQPIRKRLGDYVSQKTIEGGNSYTLKPGTTPLRLKDENGNPTGITPSSNAGANNTSYDELPESAISAFEANSNSGQLNTNSSVFRIRKGKEPVNAPTGIEILRDVNINKDRSEFVKRIQQVLVENNRFNDANPFLPRTGTINENDSNLTLTRVQTKLGEHYPRKFPTPLEAPNSSVIDIRNLKKLGALTLLHGSGEVVVPKDPNTTEQFSALAPGLARLGLRVPVSRFNPINVYKGIDSTFEKPSSTAFIEADNKLSYGNPLNYVAPFSGISATPSIVACTLLILTVTGLVKTFVAIIKPPSPQGTENIRSSGGPEQRKKFLGSYLGKKTNDSLVDTAKNILQLKLDLVPTENDFSACVSRGMNIFFGYGKDGIPVSSPVTNVGGATENIVKLHGYYNTMMRNIIRNTVDLALPGVVGSLGIISKDEGTRNQAIGSLADTVNPLSFVEKLNNSTLLRFVNIVAMIGDISLNVDAQKQVLGQGNDENEIEELTSIIDVIEEYEPGGNGINPAIVQAKSRLRNGKLAWRNNSVKSMYLIPTELVNQAQRFDQRKASEIRSAMNLLGSGGASVSDAVGSNFIPESSKLDQDSRIKAEYVQQMEDYLEKDYVPFYFHDLRTNEIINFHAFIEDVSDEYRASYNETEGYGRVDKVMTYKNTSRNISLTFKTVATDPEDFDMMWFKINKLVTLVYPQWSNGRQVSWGNNKFTQPFSQFPTASPLIRLRVGDYIKSNHSKFALARLFGISTDQSKFSLDRINRAQDGSVTFETQRRIIEAMANIRRVMEGETTTPSYQNGDIAILRGNAQSGARRTSIVGSPQYLRVGNTLPASAPTVAGRRSRGTPSRRAQTSTELNTTSNSGLVLHYDTKVTVVGRSDVRGPINSYIVQVTTPAEGQSGQFVVPFDRLYPDNEYIERKARSQVLNSSQQDTQNQTTDDAVSAFLSDTQNPIFQSFTTTKGRGLAGFITSIRFDIKDATWTTGELNKRAPKLLTIQMEFSPIHDLAPGIDSNGFNTAPLYNVGSIMKQFGKEENYTELDSKFRQANAKLR